VAKKPMTVDLHVDLVTRIRGLAERMEVTPRQLVRTFIEQGVVALEAGIAAENGMPVGGSFLHPVSGPSEPLVRENVVGTPQTTERDPAKDFDAALANAMREVTHDQEQADLGAAYAAAMQDQAREHMVNPADAEAEDAIHVHNYVPIPGTTLKLKAPGSDFEDSYIKKRCAACGTEIVARLE
jgi:flagellar hook-basal body complex protein FliE